MKKAFTLRWGYDPSWLGAAMELYNRTVMKRSDEKKVGRAFRNSFAVVTCWQNETLIGLGRVISDGEMYSGIFDVAVAPEFQKQGVGRSIVEALVAKVPGTCVHLTSTFGNEPFYLKLGFRRHKTAMAIYPQGDPRGYLL